MFTQHKVLDKDTRFILVFWQIFIAERGIKIVVLIAYYLQTDGQIERLN